MGGAFSSAMLPVTRVGSPTRESQRSDGAIRRAAEVRRRHGSAHASLSGAIVSHHVHSAANAS